MGRRDSPTPMNHPYAWPATFGTESVLTKSGLAPESVAMMPKTAVRLRSDGGATPGDGTDARVAGALPRTIQPRVATRAGRRRANARRPGREQPERRRRSWRAQHDSNMRPSGPQSESGVGSSIAPWQCCGLSVPRERARAAEVRDHVL